MKKGFTLAELMCVIIIISMLLILAIPGINNLINSEKNNISDSMQSLIYQSGELYVQNNSGIYNKTEGNVYCVKLQELIDSEYLSNPLKDPVTGNDIDTNKYIRVYVENRNYKYEISDTCESVINIETCSYDVGTTWEFSAINDVHEFDVPCSGTYKLEVWGAEGASSGGTGGKGGYSSGMVDILSTEILYTYVGGAGTVVSGGFNGGGNGSTSYTMGANYKNGGGGGGATHIAKVPGLLSTLSDQKEKVLIVAGGGGGGAFIVSGYDGGAGGGLSGANGSGYGSLAPAGGTQSTGYLFGQGQNGLAGSNASYGESGRGGGGGGYYGGYASQTTQYGIAGGGGGSGYIGGVKEGSMQSGVRLGNGYAKITLVSIATGDTAILAYACPNEKYTLDEINKTCTITEYKQDASCGTTTTQKKCGGYLTSYQVRSDGMNTFNCNNGHTGVNVTSLDPSYVMNYHRCDYITGTTTTNNSCNVTTTIDAIETYICPNGGTPNGVMCE